MSGISNYIVLVHSVSFVSFSVRLDNKGFWFCRYLEHQIGTGQSAVGFEGFEIRRGPYRTQVSHLDDAMNLDTRRRLVFHSCPQLLADKMSHLELSMLMLARGRSECKHFCKYPRIYRVSAYFIPSSLERWQVDGLWGYCVQSWRRIIHHQDECFFQHFLGTRNI